MMQPSHGFKQQCHGGHGEDHMHACMSHITQVTCQRQRLLKEGASSGASCQNQLPRAVMHWRGGD